ncbi:MAG: hypothetical protein Q8L14_07875 [Myxococcales bacterium]|nr:hypothetical protein [Myxococcales bacterium]
MDQGIADAIARLETHVRAGEEAHARADITALAARAVPLTTAEASSTADFLIGRKAFVLARFFLDTVPQAEPGWGYVLISELAEGADAKQRAALDVWLTSRGRARSPYWVKERKRFLGASASVLFDELEARIRATPTDLATVKVYLEVQEPKERSAAWLPLVVMPASAWDSFQVAEWLTSRHPAEALVLLDRATKTKLTDADRAHITTLIRTTWSTFPGMELAPDVLLARWVSEQRVKCLKATGQNAAAQAILVQLDAEDARGLPRRALSRTAGQIQAPLQQRPLERSIIEAEPLNEKDPAYWSGRADYYRGREDVAKERSALERWLALTVLTSKSTPTRVAERSAPVRAYADFLRRTGNEAAALAFLWKEYDSVTNDTHHEAVLHLLEWEYSGLSPFRSDDARLWAFLEGRATWSSTEERLLWRMAETAKPGAERDAVWVRAERAVKKVPARAATTGWVMNRTQAAERSMPLLELACADRSDEERRKTACGTLFDSCLATNRWQRAEALWPQRLEQLTVTERPDWLAQVAIAAARARALDDALRLWVMKEALDFAALGRLEELATAGARAPLIAHFERLSKERPTSTVPAAALAILRRR